MRNLNTTHSFTCILKSCNNVTDVTLSFMIFYKSFDSPSVRVLVLSSIGVYYSFSPYVNHFISLVHVSFIPVLGFEFSVWFTLRRDFRFDVSRPVIGKCLSTLVNPFT